MTSVAASGRRPIALGRASGNWILDRLDQQTEVVVPSRVEPDEHIQFALSLTAAPISPLGETSPGSIEASWRQARQLLSGAMTRVLRDHRAVYAERLTSATERNARRSVLEMLSDLSENHGVGWADTASMLGVSVPALRKWRKAGGGTTPENHRKLATLTGFFDLMNEFMTSPARWMSMRLVEGFNVRPMDVYSPERGPALLDLAAGNPGVSAESVLDGIDSEWREHWRSRYEVFEAADGELSMRPRQD